MRRRVIGEVAGALGDHGGDASQASPLAPLCELPESATAAAASTDSLDAIETDHLFFDFGLWWQNAGHDGRRRWSSADGVFYSSVDGVSAPLDSSTHRLWASTLIGKDEDNVRPFKTFDALAATLEEEGLSVRSFEREHADVDKTRYPVAIGARFSVLLQLAESAGWEKELRNQKGRVPFSLSTAIAHPKRFKGWENPLTFLSSGERIQLITYKIQTVARLRRELLSFRSRNSFFALHSTIGRELLTQAVVYDVGRNSGLGLLGGLSPDLEDHITDYFGPSLGFYFGFLSFYTQCLAIPALVGVYLSMTDEEPQKPGFEVCAFSFFLLLVAMLFMKGWRRRESELTARWLRFAHAIGQVGKTRAPDFAKGMAESRLLNIELNKSLLKWIYSKCLAWTVHAVAVVLTWISVMLMHLLDDHFPKIVKQLELFKYDQNEVNAAALFVDYFPTLVFIVALALIEPGLDWLCKEVHEWEVHENEEIYRAGLARKRINSKFFLRHSSLFWTAYYEQNANMLCKVLKTYIVVYAFTSSFLERALPRFSNMRNTAPPKSKASEDKVYAKILANSALTPYISTFDEYLTLYVQFGQVLMFSAFFPLAPACAWVANMLEARLDGFKLLCDVRRPLPLTHCCEGIGSAWADAFEAIVYMSVITNLTAIALFGPDVFWNWVLNATRTVLQQLETNGVVVSGYTAEHFGAEVIPFWYKIVLVAVAENAIFYILFKVSHLPNTTAATQEVRLEKEVKWRKAIDHFNREARRRGQRERFPTVDTKLSNMKPKRDSDMHIVTLTTKPSLDS